MRGVSRLIHDQKVETVLITGATSGIGEAIVYWFANHRPWDTLIITGRSAERLTEIKNELTLAGVFVHTILADLSSPNGASDLIQAVREYELRPSILINNAGLGASGRFSDVPWEKLESIIAVNIAALTRLTHLLLPDLAEQKGRILQLSSTGAFQPGPYTAVYYASKAYVHSLSLALANEYKGSGLSVSILCPGAVSSEFSERSGKRDIKGALTPTAVADYACPRLMKRKKLIIPGLQNKLAIFFTKLLPGSWSANIVARIQKPLLKDRGQH